MISILDKAPLDNEMCRVQVVEYLEPHPGPWRYVRSSDGYFHWDNLVDSILQHDEVTHWKSYEEDK